MGYSNAAELPGNLIFGFLNRRIFFCSCLLIIVLACLFQLFFGGGFIHDRVRSSSLPPEKVFQVRKYPRARGGRRAASLEGRELSKVEEIERPQAGRDVGRQVPSPLIEVAALRRRVGRCIMLLAKFVDRSNEEESGSGGGASTGVDGRAGV